MEKIDSTNNKLIKTLAKLEKKKYRESFGQYMIEGFHLIDEAIQSKQKYLYILGTADELAKVIEKYDLPDDQRLIEISEKIAQHLSATKTTQGIFMVLKIFQPKNFNFNFGKWVILADLADPGNVGTIIRTADAAGFDGVIISPQSVDIYNPKVQRAMQGSQFHISLIINDVKDAIQQFKNYSVPVYASMLDPEAKKLNDFDLVAQLALIIGNEAHGVALDVAELADEKLYIPIIGQAESLNAAVAAGIMIYHFSK